MDQHSALAHLQNGLPDGVRVDGNFEYTMPQLHWLLLLDRITQNATMPALPMLSHVTNEEERTILYSILTNRDDMMFNSSFLAKENRMRPSARRCLEYRLSGC